MRRLVELTEIINFKNPRYIKIRYKSTSTDWVSNIGMDLDIGTDEKDFVKLTHEKQIEFTSESYLEICRNFNWDFETLVYLDEFIYLKNS